MRGNMRCLGKLTIRSSGRLPGTLEAGQLVVEKGADLVIARPVRVSQAEIAGKVSAQIISESNVVILKSGILEGSVTAKGFNVEKGGSFQGELTIGRGAPAEESESVEKVKREPVEEAPPILGAEQKPALG